MRPIVTLFALLAAAFSQPRLTSAAAIDFDDFNADRGFGYAAYDRYKWLGAIFSSQIPIYDVAAVEPSFSTAFFVAGGGSAPNALCLTDAFQTGRAIEITFVVPGTSTPTTTDLVRAAFGDSNTGSSIGTIEAFDTNGTLIGSATQITPTSQIAILQVAVPGIARVRISVDADGGVVDNITFNTLVAGNVLSPPVRAVDPRRTFLRVENDGNSLPPEKVQLASATLPGNGILPGDYLFLESSGDFKFHPAEMNENGAAMLALFSSSDVVDPPNPVTGSTSLHRVPGRIEMGAPDVPTINTNRPVATGGLPTNIEEDFAANRIIVQVPANAQYLMLCGHDSYYGDNSDAEEDFRVKIVRVRNPDYDTDKDGSPDLAELQAGTDYLDPNSRLSAAIAFAPTPTSVRLTFTAQPHRQYAIQQSTDLSSSWNVIETLPSAPTLRIIERDYPVSPVNTFFQVIVTGMTP